MNCIAQENAEFLLEVCDWDAEAALELLAHEDTLEAMGIACDDDLEETYDIIKAYADSEPAAA